MPEILSRATGNFKEQNKVLESSTIIINYWIIIIIIIITYNYIVQVVEKCDKENNLEVTQTVSTSYSKRSP
jgi:cell division protein FtsI/penicillin-binding protein 2